MSKENTLARYLPGVPPTDTEELPVFLQGTLSSIASMVNSPMKNFAPLNEAPLKPREGDIAFANGSSWDPGAGRGLYMYNGTEWVQAATASGGGLIPIGGIIIWTGSVVPPLWTLCDGVAAPNGMACPDLQSRFLKGAGTVPVGTVGGSTTTGSTSSGLPAHSHSGSSHSHTQQGAFTSNGSGNHGHGSAVLNRGAQTYSTRGDGTIVYQNNPNNPSAIAQGGNHSHSTTISGQTGGAGTNSSHNHTMEPVYYAVAYIMRYE